MSKKLKKSSAAAKKAGSPFTDTWTKLNYYILALGGLVLLAGFILMTAGPWDNPLSLNVSPVVLIIAYAVIIPIAIFASKKKKSDTV